MIRRAVALWLVLLACLFGGVLPGYAQELPAETLSKFEAWDEVTTKAEETLGREFVSELELTTLREKLDQVRQEATALREDAEEEIGPIRAQLEALGTAPEDGTAEAPEVIAQRERVVTALAKAEAPVKTALGAYRRADAVIGKLDQRMRELFADQLFKQGSTPLNPSRWLTATGEATSSLGKALQDAVAGMVRQNSQKWPALLIGLAGLFLLIAVRRRVVQWFEKRLRPELTAHEAGRSRVFVGVGLTFSALVVPLAGITLILIAVRLSGAVNGHAASYLRDLPQLLIPIALGYWLSEVLFGPDVPARRLMPMSLKKARRAARMTVFLSLCIGLNRVFVNGETSRWFSVETLNRLNLILVLIAAISLWRLASGISSPKAEVAVDPETGDPVEPSPGTRLSRALRVFSVRAMRAVAILAPLLSIFGFFAASQFVLYPFLMTAAVLGIGLVIISLIEDGVDSVLSLEDGTVIKQSGYRLLPIVGGFGLFCVAVPLLALIWGAQRSDIGESWSMLTAGFAVGETRIRPFEFITFVVIFSIGYSVTRLLQTLLRSSVLPQTRLDSGGRMAVVSMFGYIGIVLAALAAISAVGLDLSNLAIVAGALSVGVGFGLQTIVSNFVSGLILLIERPVKEGDWVEVGGFTGTIKRISVRATEVQTFDRAIAIVPNAELISSSVLNRTHAGKTGRLIIPIGVAYGTNTRRVDVLLQEVANNCELLIQRPKPFILFKGFGADSLDFEIRGYLRDVDNTLSATNALNHAIAELFEAEGIEIPFVQRDLNIRNVEELEKAMERVLRPDTS